MILGTWLDPVSLNSNVQQRKGIVDHCAQIVSATNPKAMPVVLEPENYKTWLTGDRGRPMRSQFLFAGNRMHVN
ncbi:SOS response-associated peptidase [Sphingobium sp. B11D3A]|uniref:SOS response-associated peptidase n=1 Tax=Sphingobium sp. B11D3A TaxID=2940574 RepID=UPI0022246B38|nr:SOS response-associated peptidase [Sphingobium sp. B11D3A]MCW2392269.1 putative SOS response-associated peptidase YedK [Sphingobium sp. B11D3A]